MHIIFDARKTGTIFTNMATIPSATAVTRYLGNCQVCEGDQKLHHGRMVHHGYKRPGDGFIVCPGVHQVPYEVSCDLFNLDFQQSTILPP